MKNRFARISVLFVFIASVTMLQAQEQKQEAVAEEDKAVKKGTVAIDAYYGFPNLFFQVFIADRDKTEQFNNIGPFGIRAEYFPADRVAFGVDANYSMSSVKWNGPEYNAMGNNTGRTIPYEISITRLRVLGKFSYHFPPSENFDLYTGAGIGINNTTFTYREANVIVPYYTSKFFLEIASSIPLSWRLDFGGRYYFTKNIGLGFEIGISGGPFSSFSLCSKF